MRHEWISELFELEGLHKITIKQIAFITLEKSAYKIHFVVCVWEVRLRFPFDDDFGNLGESRKATKKKQH